MVAAHAMLRGERAGRRPALAALRGGVVAARMEAAARGWGVEARDLARDVANLAAGARHAREQPARIRVRRPREERRGRRRLHLLAGIHHDYAVADLVRGAEVVGGEEHGDAALLHQRAPEPEG